MITEQLSGFHRCSVSPTYGDWLLRDVSDDNLFLYMNDLKHLLIEDKLQMLYHNEISWKGDNLPLNLTGSECICCGGERYHNCNIKFPGIVVEASNPSNKKYRLLDGKHRIRKMIDKGIDQSLFYVLNLENIRQYFRRSS